MKKRSFIMILLSLVLLCLALVLCTGCEQKNSQEKQTEAESTDSTLKPSPKPTENGKKDEKKYGKSDSSCYDSLLFYGEDNSFELSEKTDRGYAIGDVAPFYESFTEGCDFVEGLVVNAYEKVYEYSSKSVKFEGQRAYSQTVSVIYEFEITRVWRGEYEVGKIILIEDMQLFDEQFHMKKGHKYLIPIYDAGEDIAILTSGYNIKGETKRQTPHSTQYPYHPQIEITTDGYYFFSNDWETLATEDAIKVTDVEFGEGSVYYKDKMVLLDAESFEENIKKLLSK